jgi:cytochrome c oxidase cbb3-type subunit 3
MVSASLRSRRRCGLPLGVLLAALALGASAAADRTSPQIERGRELYEKMCAICHGPRGEGYRADQAPRIASPDFLSAVNDAYLRRAIAQGRPGTTMSAWGRERGGPLSRQDVDAVVALLRSWSDAPAVRLDERPLSGDPRRGAEIYAEECVRCHGEHGRGGLNIRIGSPQFLAGVTNGFLRHAIREGRSGTDMDGFDKILGAAGIEDVVAALRSFQTVPLAREERASAAPSPPPRGSAPVSPKGKAPVGFEPFPGTTSVDTVKAQLDARARFLFVDARAPSDYATGHIAGAINVPFYDPAPHIPKLPKDVWLVCYCTCPHAESGELAGKLLDAGFTKVTVLDEGLGLWKARNYPMRKGTNP